MNQSGQNSENEPFKAMWDIQIENNVKIENKLEYNVKKAYAMIFKEFCPSPMQNRIKDNPKCDIIINDKLKLMHTISQSLNKPIRST